MMCNRRESSFDTLGNINSYLLMIDSICRQIKLDESFANVAINTKYYRKYKLSNLLNDLSFSSIELLMDKEINALLIRNKDKHISFEKSISEKELVYKLYPTGKDKISISCCVEVYKGVPILSFGFKELCRYNSKPPAILIKSIIKYLYFSERPLKTKEKYLLYNIIVNIAKIYSKFNCIVDIDYFNGNLYISNEIVDKLITAISCCSGKSLYNFGMSNVKGKFTYQEVNLVKSMFKDIMSNYRPNTILSVL